MKISNIKVKDHFIQKSKVTVWVHLYSELIALALSGPIKWLVWYIHYYTQFLYQYIQTMVRLANKVKTGKPWQMTSSIYMSTQLTV